MNLKIGFIGQGWIGKNYADDFEKRGFVVTRYAMEKPYIDNRDAIAECDIVFIAVPTPTTPEGFDYSIIKEVLGLVGKDKIAVIKSTILPGTTGHLQELYPEIFVLNSPEFLTEATAAHDAANPARNIVGVPLGSPAYHEKAKLVMSVLPKAGYEKICSSVDAETIKYGRNVLGYVRVIFSNVLYDLSTDVGADWEVVKEAMSADPDTGPTYLNPIHKSGRGAGGHCFIKDFAAFVDFYEKNRPDDVLGLQVLKANEEKNNSLLIETKKDLDLLTGVYGKDILTRKNIE